MTLGLELIAVLRNGRGRRVVQQGATRFLCRATYFAIGEKHVALARVLAGGDKKNEALFNVRSPYRRSKRTPSSVF